MKSPKEIEKERNALVSDSMNHPKEKCAGCVCGDHRSEDCPNCTFFCDVNNAATVQKVITKLEVAKVVAARDWGKLDEAALDGYIHKIRQIFNGTTPPPDKAWLGSAGWSKWLRVTDNE